MSRHSLDFPEDFDSMDSSDREEYDAYLDSLNTGRDLDADANLFRAQVLLFDALSDSMSKPRPPLQFTKDEVR